MRRNEPWAMLTTRINPKMSENPLATMNMSPASVRLFSSVIRKLLGLWTADPKFVLGAQKRIHTRAKTVAPIATPTGRRRKTRRQSNARCCSAWDANALRGGFAVCVVEGRTKRFVALWPLVGKTMDRRDHRQIEARDVGPVDLDEVPSGVADVHLHRSARELANGGAERALLEQAELFRLQVGGLEVVDVERDVMELGRRRLALEEVKLLLSEPEPLHVLGEVRARQSLHPENLSVEAKRLLHVVRMDADVVETRGSHPRTPAVTVTALPTGGRDDRDLSHPVRVARPADDRRVGRRIEDLPGGARARDPGGEPPGRDLPGRAGAGAERDRGGASGTRVAGERPALLGAPERCRQRCRDHRQSVPPHPGVKAPTARPGRDRGCRRRRLRDYRQRYGLSALGVGHRAEGRT